MLNCFCVKCGSYLCPENMLCKMCGESHPDHLFMRPGVAFWPKPRQLNLPEGCQLTHQPAFSGDNVVLAWSNRKDLGGLIALNNRTGEISWTFNKCENKQYVGAIHSGVLAIADQLFFATHKGLHSSDKTGAVLGIFYQVSPTGGLVAKHELNGGVYDLPVHISPYVFVVASDGTAWGFHTNNTSTLQLRGLPHGWLRSIDYGNKLLVAPKKGNRNIVHLSVVTPHDNGRITNRELTGCNEITSNFVSTDQGLYFGAISTEGAAIFILKKGDYLPAAVLIEQKMERFRQLLVSNEWLVAISGGWLVFYNLHIRQSFKFNADSKITAITLISIYGLVYAGTQSGSLQVYCLTSQPHILANIQSEQIGLDKKPINVLVAHNRILYVGSEQGLVTALPWHLWEYAKMGELFAQRGLYSDAGQAFTAAYAFTEDLDKKKQFFQEALNAMEKASLFNYSASLRLRNYEGRNDYLQIAQNYEKAGICATDQQMASHFFSEAVKYYELGGYGDKARACQQIEQVRSRSLLIKIREISLPKQVWANKGCLAKFELINMGSKKIKNVQIRFSGNVVCDGWKQICEQLEPGCRHEIDTQLTPIANGILSVELNCEDVDNQKLSTKENFDWEVKIPDILVKDDVGVLIIEDPSVSVEVDGMVGILRIPAKKHILLPGQSDAEQENRIVAWLLEPQKVDQAQFRSETPGYKIESIKSSLMKQNVVQSNHKTLLDSILNHLRAPQHTGENILYWHGEIRLTYILGPYTGANGKAKNLLLGLNLSVIPEKAYKLITLFGQGKSTLEVLEIRHFVVEKVRTAINIWLQSSRDHDFMTHDQEERERLMFVIEEEVRNYLYTYGLKLESVPWAYRWVDD